MRPENAWYFYTDISAGARGNLVESEKNLWLPGIDRFHVTSSLSKSKTKAPPKFLSSSGIRDGIFISVYNFTAQ